MEIHWLHQQSLVPITQIPKFNDPAIARALKLKGITDESEMRIQLARYGFDAPSLDLRLWNLHSGIQLVEICQDYPWEPLIRNTALIPELESIELESPRRIGVVLTKDPYHDRTDKVLERLTEEGYRFATLEEALPALSLPRTYAEKRDLRWGMAIIGSTIRRPWSRHDDPSDVHNFALYFKMVSDGRILLQTQWSIGHHPEVGTEAILIVDQPLPKPFNT